MPASQPRPLSQSSAETWSAVRGVFTDIDDTLTTAGRITADVFDAMERLRAAGLLVVPITGRPAGWCDMIARQWPVDAVVGENGALYYRYDQSARRMLRGYADSPDILATNQERLSDIRDEILRSVPGSAVSADQAFRVADLAIDFCEDVEPLDGGRVQRIVDIFTAHGATAKVSSIHVNGWFGDYDKLTMTKTLMSEQFSVDLDAHKELYTFAGDSPNDAPMFRYFPNAAGVANLWEFLDQCDAAPAWITPSARGTGFIELVDHILANR